MYVTVLPQGFVLNNTKREFFTLIRITIVIQLRNHKNLGPDIMYNFNTMLLVTLVAQIALSSPTYRKTKTEFRISLFFKYFSLILFKFCWFISNKSGLHKSHNIIIQQYCSETISSVYLNSNSCMKCTCKVQTTWTELF